MSSWPGSDQNFDGALISRLTLKETRFSKNFIKSKKAKQFFEMQWNNENTFIQEYSNLMFTMTRKLWKIYTQATNVSMIILYHFSEKFSYFHKIVISVRNSDEM